MNVKPTLWSHAIASRPCWVNFRPRWARASALLISTPGRSAHAVTRHASAQVASFGSHAPCQLSRPMLARYCSSSVTKPLQSPSPVPAGNILYPVASRLWLTQQYSSDPQVMHVNRALLHRMSTASITRPPFCSYAPKFLRSLEPSRAHQSAALPGWRPAKAAAACSAASDALALVQRSHWAWRRAATLPGSERPLLLQRCLKRHAAAPCRARGSPAAVCHNMSVHSACVPEGSCSCAVCSEGCSVLYILGAEYPQLNMICLIVTNAALVVLLSNSLSND